MDTARGIGHRPDQTNDSTDGAVADVDLTVGGDERRMHVRAYNYWVSLLHGRAYPSIEDLNPELIADFGAHSVLLDFSKGIEDPRIQFLGRTLREECGIDVGIDRIADVPSRSLLSRLTDHYLQIIANRAPIGFEAEFVSQRGHNTLYRGILMPFSSDEDTIDFIYGVINWKEMVDAETQAKLTAEVAAARFAAPFTSTAPVWADGPGASLTSATTNATDAIDETGDDSPADDDASLADRLVRARESAEAVRTADGRSRAALYRALNRAYDFAVAAERDADQYGELLSDAGVKVQARAPMTAVAKLVFGATYDKTRLTEFAAVLGHAARNGIAADAFVPFVEGFAGGIKGIVTAERAHRRPAAKPAPVDKLVELRARTPLARVDIEHGDAEFVVLLGRSGHGGTLEIVASMATDRALIEHAIRAAR